MTRDDAISRSTDWLERNGHRVGPLRYASYLWDFRSGAELSNRQLLFHLLYIPSPHGRIRSWPSAYVLTHGWLVVFDPASGPARCPEDCPVVWVDEAGESIRGYMPKPLKLLISVKEYDGGYRPTAVGTIYGKPFCFRMQDRSWSFGVASESATKDEFWWHSSPDEYEFETSGTCDPVWHTDSLPLLLEGLRRYLAAQAVASVDQDEALRAVSQQAEALFTRSS
jgi:hypothetical protein